MAHQANDEAVFEAAAARLRQARLRSELQVREIPAPERIAPRSIALAAGVTHGSVHPSEAEGDSPYGAGRLILMHDPASADDWGGPFRIVCFAQAPLEMEIGVDPFIADVAWSWLIDALDSRGAEYTYASGTATKTLSTGFGTLESQGDAAQIEIRASWTPLLSGSQGGDFGAHAEAWGELLCLLAGLPHHEGVASLGAKRAQRGTRA
ncbi:MAG: DUF3000 domain-containing protein [Actinobacteria bacterium]|nr:DUF3000 domain-containing protein [Actinomycetota bacterium]